MQAAIDRAINPVRFPLGRILATPGILAAFGAGGQGRISQMLMRHASGDWGSVCEADKRANDDAVLNGERLLSAYPIDPAAPCAGHGDSSVWIITEWDRSVTTILLPSEY